MAGANTHLLTTTSTNLIKSSENYSFKNTTCEIKFNSNNFTLLYQQFKKNDECQTLTSLSIMGNSDNESITVRFFGKRAKTSSARKGHPDAI